jgi:hypothetical protein
MRYLQGLHDEMAQVDEDLLEADAKNRLYQLLGERTRQEHMALDQKVRSLVSSCMSVTITSSSMRSVLLWQCMQGSCGAFMAGCGPLQAS